MKIDWEETMKDLAKNRLAGEIHNLREKGVSWDKIKKYIDEGIEDLKTEEKIHEERVL